MMKTLFLGAVLAALLTAPAASALSRNNNGATLNISPSQPIVGDGVTFSGCNYQPGIGFTITVQTGDKAGPEVFVESVISDVFGCWSTLVPFVPVDAGTYYAAVWFANGHRVASLDFTVT